MGDQGYQEINAADPATRNILLARNLGLRFADKVQDPSRHILSDGTSAGFTAETAAKFNLIVIEPSDTDTIRLVQAACGDGLETEASVKSGVIYRMTTPDANLELDDPQITHFYATVDQHQDDGTLKHALEPVTVFEFEKDRGGHPSPKISRLQTHGGSAINNTLYALIPKPPTPPPATK